MGSQPGGGHETPVVDWVAVYIMLVGSILIALAMPFKSWWLGAAGGVIFVVGAGIALAYGIMNHTEDYEVRPIPADPQADAAQPQQGKRIISA